MQHFGRAVRFVFFLFLAMTSSSAAWAHRFEHPKVIRLGLRADRIVLAVTLDVNPGGEALRTRGLFDRDADGRLDDEEQARLAAYLVKTATLWLKVTIDGAPLDLTRAKVTWHRLDQPADDTTTLGIAMLVEAERATGPLSIVLEDRDKDREAHVPVVVDLAPQDRVRLASQGEWDSTARRIDGVRLAKDRPLVLQLAGRP